MLIRISLMISAAFSTTAIAVAGEPNAELNELAGSWTLVRGWSNGKSMAEILDSKGVEIDEFRIEVAGSNLAMHGGAPGPFTYTVTLRPNSTPKGIDLKATATPGRQFVEHTVRGIYELEGDELKLSLPSDYSSERPIKFDFDAGTRLMLLELRRQ